MSCNRLTTGKPSVSQPDVGTFIELGNKELEIDRAISRTSYLSGECFGRAPAESVIADAKPSHASASTLTKKFVPLKPITLNSGGPSTRVTDTCRDDLECEKDSSAQILDKPRLEVTVNDIKKSCWSANW